MAYPKAPYGYGIIRTWSELVKALWWRTWNCWLGAQQLITEDFAVQWWLVGHSGSPLTCTKFQHVFFNISLPFDPFVVLHSIHFFVWENIFPNVSPTCVVVLLESSHFKGCSPWANSTGHHLVCSWTWTDACKPPVINAFGWINIVQRFGTELFLWLNDPFKERIQRAILTTGLP